MRLIYRPHFHAWTRATSWAAHTASRTRFARSRPRRAQPERRQRTGRRRKQAGDVQDSSDSSGRGSRRRAPPEPGADAPRRVEHTAQSVMAHCSPARAGPPGACGGPETRGEPDEASDSPALSWVVVQSPSSASSSASLVTCPHASAAPPLRAQIARPGPAATQTEMSAAAAHWPPARATCAAPTRARFLLPRTRPPMCPCGAPRAGGKGANGRALFSRSAGARTHR